MSSLESDLRIELIREESSPYVKEVNELADANSRTLGFLPRPVYKQRAKDPGILVAFIDQNMVGYLMWSINTKKRTAKLLHLCIKPEYRGRQIAKLLNNELIKLARNYSREIRLECKDNYGIDEMWRALGYSSIFEKPAKMKGDTLKVWSIQFANSTLPSIFSCYTSDFTNLKCSIDAYTLQNFIEEDKQELSIEWLRTYLNVCVTEEILNEIDKVYFERRTHLRNLVNSQFLMQICEPLDFQESFELLKNIVTKNKLELDEVSVRHIARCLAADIPYFITQKNNLLNLSSFFYESIGLRIISLEDAIDLRDTNTDIIEYEPLRLENKSVQFKILDEFKLEIIATAIFTIYPNSSRDELFKNLRRYNIKNNNFQDFVLTYQGEPNIIVVYDISQKEQLEVPLLRVLKEISLTTTLLNFVVHKLLEIAISKKCSFLKITDPFIREPEKLILERQYFTKNIQGFEWVKPCYRETLKSTEIISYLGKISKDNPEYSNMSHCLKSWLNSEEVLNDPLHCMDMERLLWPLKIEDAYIPNFIIPIKPEYAKELFDKKLARENLFGVQRTELFLGLDTIYYKNSKSNAGLKKAPARIFWYVSKSKDSGYSNLSSIRACSQVDYVIVDTPEALYTKFQHLGYYNLEQIKSCSKSNQVMAIKFSHTELFENPIHQNVIKQCLESSAPMQSMRQISQEEFITLYRLGFNLKPK